MTSNNPHTTIDESVDRSERRLRLGYGYIDSSEPHEAGDDNKHLVRIQPRGKNVSIPAQMGVMASGDVHIPTETEPDIPVLYGIRGDGTYVILSLLYSAENDVPAYEPGERILGHALTDANIYFDVDGNIIVSGDGDSNVQIKADGSIVAEGASGETVTVQGDGTISVDSDGNSTVEVNSDGSITITGSTGATVTVQTSGTIDIESDGGATVSIQSDGDVVINGGSKGVIYDINTTTDADGHVTSVDPQRRSDILI